MAKKKKSNPIAREEWDFCMGSVSDESLGACLLYEYAREKLKRSPKLQKIFKDTISPSSSIGWYRRVAPYFRGDYGTPPIPIDLLETPWLKSSFAKISPEEQSEFGVKSDQRNAPAFFREEEFYSQTHFPVGFSTIDHFKSIIPSLMRSRNRTQSEECDLRYGFFCIDLNMADKPIVELFSGWLSSYRSKVKQGGKRNAINDATGKSFTAIQQRTLLKQLGAVRLIASGRTMDKAMDDSARESKNKEPIYSDPKQWTKAKDAVELGISRLFPKGVL